MVNGILELLDTGIYSIYLDDFREKTGKGSSK